MTSDSLLSIRDLRTYFHGPQGVIKAVDGVDFEIQKGSIVGLVGESGSGKSTTALSIMRLIRPPGRIVGGEVIFNGEDLLKRNPGTMNLIRGKSVAMVFQDPLTFLNPVIRVGNQIAEAISLHQGLGKEEAMKEAVRVMGLVRIQGSRAKDYPHQMSGGMRQRIMLAMAISCKPKLLICDEVTTALDILTQAEILELLMDLKRSLSLSILMVTHDLGVVASMCDKVIVMYAGKVVETSDALGLFSKPSHPYTKALLASIPKTGDPPKMRLKGIEGYPPNPSSFPAGCRFHPRCLYTMEVCRTVQPPNFLGPNGGSAACWLLKPEKEIHGQTNG